jgi:pyruvyltransferase
MNTKRLNLQRRRLFYINKDLNKERIIMKKIKLAYPVLNNAGDLLNKDLVERLSGLKIERSKVYNADMFAIGGALFGLQYSKDIKRKTLQKILRVFYRNKPLYVWGSGFLYNDNDSDFYRDNLVVCALRGEKTRQKLSDITGRKYDVPLADPGLLADLFIEKNIEKKHEIGLIPHFSQQNDPVIKRMMEDPEVHFIDIKKNPIEVIYEIASCECIASSSLHGLIFADSLHIPSLHIIGETELPGGNFKFEDYYSSFGLEDTPWIMDKNYPKANDIINSYKIKPEDLEEKKKALLASFPNL